MGAKPGNWLGLIAVAHFVLAAGFILKLSIETEWLTPGRQIGLAIVLGMSLVGAGFAFMKSNYLSPAFLDLGPREEFAIYYYVLASIAFSTISIWVRSRTLTIVSAYLAILMAAANGFGASQSYELIALVLFVHFLIFSGPDDLLRCRFGSNTHSNFLSLAGKSRPLRQRLFTPADRKLEKDALTRSHQMIALEFFRISARRRRSRGFRAGRFTRAVFANGVQQVAAKARHFFCGIHRLIVGAQRRRHKLAISRIAVAGESVGGRSFCVCRRLASDRNAHIETRKGLVRI